MTFFIFYLPKTQFTSTIPTCFSDLCLNIATSEEPSLNPQLLVRCYLCTLHFIYHRTFYMTFHERDPMSLMSSTMKPGILALNKYLFNKQMNESNYPKGYGENKIHPRIIQATECKNIRCNSKHIIQVKVCMITLLTQSK